ncbi:hypothetical protein Bca52824_029988 [Brassica carinata]|uniref:Uncharacterized protein n=1 Tax=Brassica carinata TaxID=52824 RepID=A0A8X7V403_BRACI|nr:hypothetical protein Bca52824_029988 [Brassica carinata]
MAESPSQSAAQLVAHQSLGHEAESDLSSLVFGLFFSLLLLVVFTLSSDLGISASSYMFSVKNHEIKSLTIWLLNDLWIVIGLIA